MVEMRMRKKKIQKIEPFEPPEDKYGMILIINDIKEDYQGHEWYEDFRKGGETIYETFGIRYAYDGMPAYIYLTSCKGIAADAKVGSKNAGKGTPLIQFREINDPINKDELIELEIFKKVPQILKYISKTQYEAIESLFE